jgi:hypothetical protein
MEIRLTSFQEICFEISWNDLPNFRGTTLVPFRKEESTP